MLNCAWMGGEKPGRHVMTKVAVRLGASRTVQARRGVRHSNVFGVEFFQISFRAGLGSLIGTSGPSGQREYRPAGNSVKGGVQQKGILS